MTVKLIGTNTSGNDPWGAGYIIMAKFTADVTGNVTEIKIDSDAAGNAKVAIYADNSGSPAALLKANNTGQACSAGVWNTLTIDSTPVVQGTVYWIAVIADALSVRMSYAVYQSGVVKYKAADYAGFSFPDPAGTGYTDYLYLSAFAGWGTTGWAHIAKVLGVASASISKVDGVAVAAISKVDGVTV